jgi:hypothetical protein
MLSVESLDSVGQPKKNIDTLSKAIIPYKIFFFIKTLLFQHILFHQALKTPMVRGPQERETAELVRQPTGLSNKSKA